MNSTDHDTRHGNMSANQEPADAWLEEQLLIESDHLLFVPDGRVSREAAIVFELITQFDAFSITVEDIAATFLWHVARAERALNRLEESLAEGHRRHPEFIARMVLVRDPHRVWIDVLPDA